MNRLNIYTQFASYAEQTPNYNHNKYGIVELVMSHFGLKYIEDEFMAKENHDKNLKILKKFIEDKATYQQLDWLKKEIINHNPFENDCTNKVFLGMVMDKNKLPEYEEIQNAIENAVRDTNNYIYASNNDLKSGDIMSQILDEIRACKFAIFDFTAQNTGVYFEAGYALALGKTVLFTCRENDMKNLHFDVNHFRFLKWNNYDELRSILSNAIADNNLIGN